MALHSKRGLDITWRFRPIAETVGKLRAASAIIDDEIVALDPDVSLIWQAYESARPRD